MSPQQYAQFANGGDQKSSIDLLVDIVRHIGSRAETRVEEQAGLFGAFGGAISATGTLSRSHSVCSSVISLTSVSALLPPSVPLQLEQVKQHGPTLTLTVSSTQGTRACPVCGQD